MQEEQPSQPTTLTNEKPKRRLSVSYSDATNSKKRKAEATPDVSEDSDASQSEEDLSSMDGMTKCTDNNCGICYRTERWQERDHMIPVHFHKIRTMEDGWTIMNYLPEILIPYHSMIPFMITERSKNVTYHISSFDTHISVYHN